MGCGEIDGVAVGLLLGWPVGTLLGCQLGLWVGEGEGGCVTSDCETEVTALLVVTEKTVLIKGTDSTTKVSVSSRTKSTGRFLNESSLSKEIITEL